MDMEKIEEISTKTYRSLLLVGASTIVLMLITRLFIFSLFYTP